MVLSETHAMKHLTISLTPNGSFRLHLTTHSVIIPATEAGIYLLATTIRDWQALSTPAIATPGNPTQHQINEALRGASWGQVLQLAGHRRRRAEIKAATGITVRTAKRKKPASRQLSLADLGL